MNNQQLTTEQTMKVLLLQAALDAVKGSFKAQSEYYAGMSGTRYVDEFITWLTICRDMIQSLEQQIEDAKKPPVDAEPAPVAEQEAEDIIPVRRQGRII
jgi:hypothetical protein